MLNALEKMRLITIYYFYTTMSMNISVEELRQISGDALGDNIAVSHWWNAPCELLGGNIPLVLSNTYWGRRQIEVALKTISNNGVYKKGF